MLNFFKFSKNERGASAIEFALYMPLFIILFFGLFDWSQVFANSIRLSTIAREAALAANRDCKGAIIGGRTVQQCLDDVRDEAFNRAVFMFPDFLAQSGTIHVNLFDAGGVDTFSSMGGQGAQIARADIPADVIAITGAVAVSEIYYDSPLIMRIINWDFLNGFGMPTMIYRNAVV